MKRLKYLLSFKSLYLLIIFTLAGCGSSDNGVTQSPKKLFSIPTSVIQKGPFVSGSSITIQKLDNDYNPSGSCYSTQTKNDFGEFSLGRIIDSNIVEVIAKGYYFDEVAGSLSTGELTLRAVVDLDSTEKVNVNILTTLSKDRIIYLITEKGKSFNEAKKQAELEVLSIFNIPISEDITTFETMDFTKNGESNAKLLAVSAILQQGCSVAELSELISKINIDIKNDGILNNQLTIDKIKANSIALNMESVRMNILNRYTNLGLDIYISNFEDYVDSDGDGLLNKNDFQVNLQNVNGADLTVEYQSNEITINLPPAIATATISISNGTLEVNGVSLVEKTAQLNTGDKFSIKLVSSNQVGTEVSSDVLVTYASYSVSGKFIIRTKETRAQYLLDISGTDDWCKGIAIDSIGNIYFTSNPNGAASYSYVKKTNSSGIYITQWGGAQDNTNGHFQYPHDVAVDSNDNVYVVDDQYIQTFSSSGVFLRKMNIGGMNTYMKIAGGKLYLSNGKVYSLTGDEVSAWCADSSYQRFCVDPDGNTYQIGYNSVGKVITKRDAAGTFLGEFAIGSISTGPDEGPFIEYFDGKLFVVFKDMATNILEVLELDLTGTLLLKWPILGNYGMSPEFTIDLNGNIYISCSWNYGVIKKFKYVP